MGIIFLSGWKRHNNIWLHIHERFYFQNNGQELNQHEITKVIILAYLRSGSTFASHMFLNNPEAFFWFEPIDGVYSHLYGTLQATTPLDNFQMWVLRKTGFLFLRDVKVSRMVCDGLQSTDYFTHFSHTNKFTNFNVFKGLTIYIYYIFFADKLQNMKRTCSWKRPMIC